MSEAAATPGAVTVQTPSGPVTTYTNQTPAERQAVIAKGYGVTIEKLTAPGPPPGVHWDPIDRKMVSTVPEVERPAPEAPKAAGHAERKDLEGWHQHLRAATAKPEDIRVPPGMDVHAPTIDALNKTYRARYTAAETEAERDHLRAIYEKDMREVMTGRKVTESREEWLARTNNGSTPPPPGGDAPPLTPQQTHTAQQWQEGHKSVTDESGYIPLERINTAGLSGYTLPKLVDGQTYHASIFAELANAREAGITQAQLTAHIRAQMKRDGIIK
jgi:hypothetical protein